MLPFLFFWPLIGLIHADLIPAVDYYGEQDCADAFDDAGLSARYFDQE